MELNNISFLILDIIDMTLALFIGTFLIFINKKKNKSVFLLGFILSIIGFFSFISIIEILAPDKNNLYYKLPFNFFWIVSGLLYIYVDTITIKKNIQLCKLYITISFLDLFSSLIIYFLPYDFRLIIEKSYAYLLHEIIGLLFFFFTLIIIFFKVRANSTILKNQYSSLEYKDLLWLNKLIVFSLVSVSFIAFSLLFIPSYYSELMFTILGVFFTFGLSYNGLHQQISKNLEAEYVVKHVSSKKNNCNNRKNIEKYKCILDKVENLVKEEELFLNSDLTIITIAEKVNEHPRSISKAINNINNENFNNYINRFRVEFAKEILLDNDYKHLNIEGIGFKSGFKSNSSFYASFKKHLKTTPSKYIKNNNLSVSKNIFEHSVI